MATGWRDRGLGWPDWRFRGVGEPLLPGPVGRMYPPSLRIAAKIYSSAGLTSSDAAWIAERIDLLIADASVNDIVDDMKAARPEILLLRYIATPIVAAGEPGQFKTVVWDQGDERFDDWFWPDSEGEKIWKILMPGTYYVLPHADGATGWPDFFADAVLAYIGNRAFDGVHGDIAVHLLQKYGEYELLKYHYDDDNALFQADQEPHIARLRSRFNDAGFFFMTNNFGINNDYFIPYRIPSIDGFNHQWIFVSSGIYGNESWIEALMNKIDEAVALGKLAVIQPAPNWDQEQINYCVHCYMLVSKNPYTHLCLDFGGAFSNLQKLFNDYGSAFEIDFGQPLGARYKENGIWKREFEYGLLQIDLVNHTYSFAQPETQLPGIFTTGRSQGGLGPVKVTADFGGLVEAEREPAIDLLDVTNPVEETKMVQAGADGSVRGRTRSIEPIRARMPHGNRVTVALPRGTELRSELDYGVTVQGLGGAGGASYTARHLGGGKVMIESSEAEDTAEIEVTIQERTRQRN